ncbi:membrane protein [Rhizobium leguminosarum bv. trifolii CB782]|nr:membrane protein [Rhizobium leguminosarum bv. trifolii CB782]
MKSDRTRPFPLAAFAVAAFCVLAGNAFAHGSGAGGSRAGLDIPEISHGEMAVISDYRSRIIELASRAVDTNEPFRRVLNYAEIQYSYCLWGRVPGSVTDEESPFNECTHAYLAAAKAVLFSMREMPREAVAAGELISAVDADMVRRGLALVTCQFSGQAFNTADVVKPRWSGIPFHAASMASLTAFASLLVFAVFGLCRLLRPTAQSSE